MSVVEDKKQTVYTFFDMLLKVKLMQEAKITTQILFAFIFIALFSKLIFTGIQSHDDTGSHGAASINIMSYSIILISVLSIVFLNTMLHTGEMDTGSPIKSISWDLVVLTVYLCWLISINMRHYKRINLQRVPPHYYLYSNLSMLVVAGQSFFFMVHYILNNDEYSKQEDILGNNKDLVLRLDFIHYIFIFLNFLLILIQQIILDNFSVDII